MYNIYEEKEFLSLKMFSFIGHGYDLASFQCYLYNRDMFFKTFYWTAKIFQDFVYIARVHLVKTVYYEEWNHKFPIDSHMFITKYLP